MIAGIWSPPEHCHRSILPIVPWKVSPNRVPWNHGRWPVLIHSNHSDKREPPYVGGFFVVSIGGTSPSSQSCSLAKASHAACIRLYRRCKGSFVVASASRAQFSAFSRK